MGSWDELDIEVTVELDTSDLDEAISIASGDYFTDLVVDELESIKNELTVKSDELANTLAGRAKSLQELMISLNGTIGHGGLLNSISVEDNGDKSYLIGTNITHFYPLVVEKGRGEVRPVFARYLHYFTLSGKEIFSKYSKPFAGKPYVQPAYESLTREADSIIDGVFGGL